MKADGLVGADLRRHAELRPDAFALDDGQVRVTWSELLERVLGAARELRWRGVRPGDRLALEGGSPTQTVTWFLAADWLGAAALVTDPLWSAAERRPIDRAARPSYVIDASQTRASTRPLSITGDDETLFYLGTTSGSTGGPKVFTRTRRSWHRTFPAFTDLTGLSTEDVVLTAGRMSTSGGLFAVMHAISAGAGSLILPDWSPTKAAALAREATVAHLIPAMLNALEPIWRQDPAGLHTILTVGAKLDSDLAVRVEKALPGCRIVEYYGSSEQSLISARTTEPPHSVGTPPSNVDIEIRDGEVFVRSDMLFAGYLSDGVHAEAGDWVSVGDHGILDASGALIIHGRGATVVVSGGTKVCAEEVEAVLRNAPGVTEAVVVGLPHPRLGQVVAAVLQPASVDRRAVRAYAADRLSPGKRPRRWLPVDRIPLTASGKVARAAVAEMLS
ncbi:class I adenylate-forming enzyme family protein [Fodinicola acaciae]|uniref:class I adenylate-forming enzyme family protein n=1 Tax=Fodinicola acaciae TaxID=2681555 RepID=UPI0013D1468D|nr:AMP-binding protein [Fodinicola acaciae]